MTVSSHMTVRVWVPPPHVTEHDPHGPAFHWYVGSEGPDGSDGLEGPGRVDGPGVDALNGHLSFTYA